MVRETSIDCYNRMVADGSLGKRDLEVIEVMAFNTGEPMTANEIGVKMPRRVDISHQNIHTKLWNMRNKGVVEEVGKRVCTVSGNVNLTFELTDRLPVKFEKPERIKCKSCNGKGYHQEQQGRLNI